MEKIASIQKELSNLKMQNEALEKAKNDSSYNNATISTSLPSRCENCKALESKTQ